LGFQIFSNFEEIIRQTNRSGVNHKNQNIPKCSHASNKKYVKPDILDTQNQPEAPEMNPIMTKKKMKQFLLQDENLELIHVEQYVLIK